MGGNYLNELSELFLRIFYKGKNYDRARGVVTRLSPPCRKSLPRR
jgi:hypothetical protein